MRLPSLADVLFDCESREELLATLVSELPLGVVIGAAEEHGWKEVRRAWRWWAKQQAAAAAGEARLAVSADERACNRSHPGPARAALR